MKLETAHDSGLRSAQPTPTVDQTGLLYYVTDERVMERWSGTAWVVVGTHVSSAAVKVYAAGRFR